MNKNIVSMPSRPWSPAPILVLVLLLAASQVYAVGRGKIAGNVTDEATGQPLVGVNIEIVELGFGCISDNKGDFYLANLPVGSYSVRFTMIGYATKTFQQVGVSTDNTTALNAGLTQTVLEGREVTVLAKRLLIDEDNTSSATIVKSDELVNRATTELMDVLQTMPSVNLEDGNMTIRGGTLEEVSFIVDGTRIRNPLDHTPYTNLNLSSVQELQVITGAFNAEYGEARSGVINIISKDGSDRFEFAVDTRYTPPGKRHWGVALYDLETSLYWENSHARHLDWWIEYPDMWVDDHGISGDSPYCHWTAEEAYRHYMETHQPLTDYLNTPSYLVELSLGGPLRLMKNLYFFATLKYRSQAPLYGNAYLDRGTFTNGTLKLTWRLDPATKLTYSGFRGQDHTTWGIDGPPDTWYALVYGMNSRYAYNDWYGLQDNSTSGNTVILSRMFSSNTMGELKLSRINARRKQWPFPNDPIGWTATDATYDILRAFTTRVDTATGKVITTQIVGGYRNAVGYHTSGYYYRFKDNNTEWSLSGFIGSQRNKYWYVKSGFEAAYYILDHFNQAKFPDRRDDQVYRPYQGALYFQNKLEFGGFIMNAGLRLDLYNANDTVYTDIFDPVNSGTEKTRLFSQLSPRLGISHPISDRSVLHFSYGHFFQRASFGDYGEGNDNLRGSLTTFIIDGSDIPWVLGNRNLRPLKTVAYEVGLERSLLDIFSLTVTGFYKDIRNTVKNTFVETPVGSYTTTGNGDYADYRGIEFSLRKYAVNTPYGATSGYINYTTQIGIDGRSGDPVVVRHDGSQSFAPSGDFIVHDNPRLKLGIFYTTPEQLGLLRGALRRITLSLEHVSVFPNDQLMGDIFMFEGRKYIRPPDRNTNLRIRKGVAWGRQGRVSAYAEVHNLLNDKWIYFPTIYSTSLADQRRFVDSDFEDIPTHDLNGTPIFEAAKYRNLPRSLVLGLTLEF